MASNRNMLPFRSSFRDIVLFTGIYLLAVGGAHPVRTQRSPPPFGRERQRLTIVTIMVEPYVQLRWEPGLIGNDRYEGYFVDLIRQIADDVGFDYRLQLVADGKFGSRSEEEGWNGMVGELLRETADIALGPVLVTPAREAVVDFTDPVSDVRITAVVAKPRQGSPLSISSIEDLLNQRGLLYGVIRGSETEAALKTSSDRNYRALWDSIRFNYMSNTVENIYEGLERVRREKFALLMDAPAAEYHVRQVPCDLAATGSFLEGKRYAFGVRKGSPLKDQVSQALSRLKARPIDWMKTQETWWKSNCPGVPAYVKLGSGKLYTEPTGLVVPESTTPPRKKVLQVTTLLKEPYVMRQHGGTFTGYIVDLLDQLAALVPFEYSLALVKDRRKYGRRKKGRWTGMIGELLRGEADMAAAPFTYHRKHSKVVDYTKPFLHSTFSIVIQTPRNGEELSILFLEDLLNDTDVQFGVVKGSLTERQLKSSKEPLYKQIWSKVKKWKNVIPSMSKALKRVRSGRFALLTESTDGAYVASRLPCDLMVLDQFLSITNYMFALKKGNPLVQDINGALLSLQQDGALQRPFHRWFNSDECVGLSESDRIVTFNETDVDTEGWISETDNRGETGTDPSSSPEEHAGPPLIDVGPHHFDTDKVDEEAERAKNKTTTETFISPSWSDIHMSNVHVAFPRKYSTTLFPEPLPSTTQPRVNPGNRFGEDRPIVAIDNDNEEIDAHNVFGKHLQTTTPSNSEMMDSKERIFQPEPFTTGTTHAQRPDPKWELKQVDFDLFFSTPNPRERGGESHREEDFRYKDRTSWNPFLEVEVEGDSVTPTVSPREDTVTQRGGGPNKEDGGKDTVLNEVEVKKSNVVASDAQKYDSTHQRTVGLVVLFFLVIGGE